MIRRYLGPQQLRTVGRRAQLSFLATHEEFPHQALPTAAAKSVIAHSKLEGGAQLLTLDNSSSTVNLKFAVVGGSSTESAHQKGAAQFLAAAAYAGNKKNSGLRIVRFLESLGAQFSSYADASKIVYEVNVLPDRVEPVVAVILAAISSAPHAPYVFEEARTNVNLNFEKQSHTCGFNVDQLVLEAAFGETSPLGTPLSAMNKVSVDDVLAYRAAHFVQQNLVIAGSGIAQDRLKALVAQHVNGIANGAAAHLPEFAYVGGDLKVRSETNGASQLAIAFPFSSEGAANQVVLSALTTSLAAKNIHARPFLHHFGKGGIVGVRTMGDAATATANLRSAVAELKSLASATDFSSARKKVALEQFGSFQANPTCHLIGSHIHKIDVVADARKIADKTVQDAAAQLLKAKPTFVVYGATAGTPSSAQQLLA